MSYLLGGDVISARRGCHICLEGMSYQLGGMSYLLGGDAMSGIPVRSVDYLIHVNNIQSDIS